MAWAEAAAVPGVTGLSFESRTNVLKLIETSYRKAMGLATLLGNDNHDE
jgi:hypothetical protein